MKTKQNSIQSSLKQAILPSSTPPGCKTPKTNSEPPSQLSPPLLRPPQIPPNPSVAYPPSAPPALPGQPPNPQTNEIHTSNPLRSPAPLPPATPPSTPPYSPPSGMPPMTPPKLPQPRIHINNREVPQAFYNFLQAKKISIPEDRRVLDRCEELFEMGFTKDALKISQCGVSRFIGGRYVKHLYCNHRLCPICANTKWRRYSSAILAQINKMSSPHVYIFAVRSNGLNDLAYSLDRLHEGLTKLRAMPYFRENVKSAAGAVEAELTGRQNRWLVHCHLILDVDNLNEKKIRKFWKDHIGNNGYFKPHENCEVQLSYAHKLAEYISKPHTRCPDPYDYPPEAFEALYHGLKWRRIPIIWKRIGLAGHLVLSRARLE